MTRAAIVLLLAVTLLFTLSTATATIVDNTDSRYLEPSQGWVLFRVLPTWSSGSEPGEYPTLFSEHVDSTTYMEVYYRKSDHSWSCARRLDSYGLNTRLFYTVVAGEPFTLICTWTATDMRVHVNGRTDTASNTSIPPTFPSFIVGSGHPYGAPFGGVAVSCAFGKGTFTLAELEALEGLTLHGALTLGNIQIVAPASQPTFAWDSRREGTGVVHCG